MIYLVLSKNQLVIIRLCALDRLRFNLIKIFTNIFF